MIHSIILLTILLTTSILEISCQNFVSPCPNVFEYQIDQNTNQIYGLIQVSDPNSNVMLLNIELSIGNPVRVSNNFRISTVTFNINQS